MCFLANIISLLSTKPILSVFVHIETAPIFTQIVTQIANRDAPSASPRQPPFLSCRRRPQSCPAPSKQVIAGVPEISYTAPPPFIICDKEAAKPHYQPQGVQLQTAQADLGWEGQDCQSTY